MFIIVSLLSLSSHFAWSQCIDGDCQTGKGAILHPDNNKYVGNFQEGLPHGLGTLFYPDGRRYTGEWVNGKREGGGVMVFSDGNLQRGLWRNDKMIRPVQLEKTINLTRKGCIQGNCVDGEGTYVAYDGSRYRGNFQEGLFHGQGICHFDNGDKYEGQWFKGLFHGKGTMHFTSGKVIYAQWVNGVVVQVLQPGAFDPNIDTAHLTSHNDIKVWALIVGVAHYNHMEVLRYTDDDAYRMAMFLKSPEGGALPEEQIVLLIDEDAEHDNIVSAMQTIFAKADSNDIVLFYFSGHGVEGAFVPYDYDGIHNLLAHTDVRDMMERSAAKFKVCIADACHSGGLETFAARGPSDNIIDRYYAAFDQAQNSTVLLLSSQSEEKSLESSGMRQGIFSHFLIRALKGEADSNQDKIIDISELFAFVHHHVREYTHHYQTPIIKGVYDPRLPLAVVR